VIRPTFTALTAPDLAERLVPPFASRSFPDYVVPAGDYLFGVAFDGGGLPGRGVRETLQLPISVRDGKITGLILRLPQLARELSRPYPIADTRLGVVARSVMTMPAEGGLVLHVKTSDPDPGTVWYVLALPAGIDGESIRVTRAGRTAARDRGFVTARLLDQPVLIVRSEGQSDRIEIDWGV
jgi:hypothetical protein